MSWTLFNLATVCVLLLAMAISSKDLTTFPDKVTFRDSKQQPLFTASLPLSPNYSWDLISRGHDANFISSKTNLQYNATVQTSLGLTSRDSDPNYGLDLVNLGYAQKIDSAEIKMKYNATLRQTSVELYFGTCDAAMPRKAVPRGVVPLTITDVKTSDSHAEFAVTLKFMRNRIGRYLVNNWDDEEDFLYGRFGIVEMCLRVELVSAAKYPVKYVDRPISLNVLFKNALSETYKQFSPSMVLSFLVVADTVSKLHGNLIEMHDPFSNRVRAKLLMVLEDLFSGNKDCSPNGFYCSLVIILVMMFSSSEWPTLANNGKWFFGTMMAALVKLHNDSGRDLEKIYCLMDNIHHRQTTYLLLLCMLMKLLSILCLKFARKFHHGSPNYLRMIYTALIISIIALIAFIVFLLLMVNAFFQRTILQLCWKVLISWDHVPF